MRKCNDEKNDLVLKESKSNAQRETEREIRGCEWMVISGTQL